MNSKINSIKKLLLITSYAESILNFRGPLILALQSKGLVVHVAAPDITKNGLIHQQLESMGLSVHQIPMLRNGTNPLADIRTIWSLLCLMRKISPTMILCYTIKPVIYGTLAAWFAKVPQRIALITGLGYAFQERGKRRRLLSFVQILYRVALRRTSLVFFQNPDDLILFKARGILCQHTPICVINGSGVDLKTFAFKPFSLLASVGVMQFLFIGRLLGDKGVYEYVQAARLIKRTHPEVRCSIVGWIDSNPDSIFKYELDEWVADGSIEYLGRLTDVRPAIEACSVFVLPSYREGTPRSVLEAMSIGRPIITTDAPGCRETVIDGENGFLVPVGNVDALVEAMQKFIEDPTLISCMGARSRQIAEDKYDVHKVNAEMLKAMGL